jgi:hypothetical protein
MLLCRYLVNVYETWCLSVDWCYEKHDGSDDDYNWPVAGWTWKENSKEKKRRGEKGNITERKLFKLSEPLALSCGMTIVNIWSRVLKAVSACRVPANPA